MVAYSSRRVCAATCTSTLPTTTLTVSAHPAAAAYVHAAAHTRGIWQVGAWVTKQTKAPTRRDWRATSHLVCIIVVVVAVVVVRACVHALLPSAMGPRIPGATLRHRFYKAEVT